MTFAPFKMKKKKKYIYICIHMRRRKWNKQETRVLRNRAAKKKKKKSCHFFRDPRVPRLRASIVNNNTFERHLRVKTKYYY